MDNKLALGSLILKIHPKQRQVCLEIIKDYRQQIDNLPGSKTKHQNWTGGYRDHIEETMNIACLLYDAMNSKRKLKFNLSEALFTLFLHDFDKIVRYSEGKEKFECDYIKLLADLILKKYNYSLNPDEINALKYVHGEGNDYHSTERIMFPLTTFIHCCDMISARIWFEEGRDNENW